MKKEFVPYELSLELKQLGFDEACICYYDIEDTNKLKPTPMKEEINSFHFNSVSTMVAAPLYQQAFRWFREKYELYSFVFTFDEGFGYETYKEGVTQTNESFDTYEEAELACLQKLIEIVKTK